MAPLDVKRTLGTRHFARLRQIGPDFTIADHARGVTYFLLRTSRHARRPGVQSPVGAGAFPISRSSV